MKAVQIEKEQFDSQSGVKSYYDECDVFCNNYFEKYTYMFFLKEDALYYLIEDEGNEKMYFYKVEGTLEELLNHIDEKIEFINNEVQAMLDCLKRSMNEAESDFYLLKANLLHSKAG